MNKSPKKLWKRSLGILLTAVMVMTAALPTAAYGVELNARAGGFSEAIAGTVELLAGNGSSAENGIALQDTEGDSSDAATAAMEYLQTNYVNGRIISNGGTGITQDPATCTVTVGRKTPSGSSITSINIKSESSSGEYASGWYLKEDPNNLLNKAVKASKPGSIGITRPTAAMGAQSLTLTLKLFEKGTDTDKINDDTAEALASQDFTIIILPEAATYDVSFQPVDSETQENIANATITLQESWNTVSPSSTGGYEGLSEEKTYTLKITADGYQDYKKSFRPSQGGEVKIPMTKTSYSTINFNVKDSTGKNIDGAAVKVKQGYYDTVSPQSDGSYKLKNGVTYNYTVEAANYTSINSVGFTPSGDQTIDVTMTKNISKYNVTFKPVDSNDEDITNAKITVTYDEEDDWGDEETIAVNPEKDGSYKLDKSKTYNYTITADGYEKATGTYKPSGDDEDIAKKITLKSTKTVDPADQEKVDAIKKKFDKETSVLRPDFSKDKKITDLVLRQIKGYTDLTTDGVTVELKTSGDTDYIKDDGTIVYKAGTLDQWGNNSTTVTGNIFVFKAGNAEAVSAETRATICWDRDYFKSQMQKEADSLTWNTIKNANLKEDEVTTDLTLPQCMGTSARNVWSKVTWTSSDPSVISIDKTGYDSMIDPKKGTVTQPSEDRKVTLTATFQANDTTINTYVEQVGDFGTITKTFEVTVKGKQTAKPTEDELKAILDKYYTAASLQDFNTKETLDTSNVTGDIQLPRYTRIKDENNEAVFANKEITVTTDKEDILKINGYCAAVDRFASQNEKETVNLIVTFTRDGVTVSKKIPLIVSMITDKELDKELAMMEKAKEHYFDGINDGKYADKDSITGNLHAFCEMSLDEQGNPVWAYDVNDKTGTGIIPDDYQDGSLGQTGWPYNRFKSSNNAIVTHENLLVTRPENSTKITISSLLSSEKYGKFAKDHPNNEKLQKLYKQEVSVTVTVKGTKASAEALLAEIESAQKLHDSMVEGTQPGEYQKGAKAALAEAIARAQAVADDKNATEAQQDAAIAALQQAVKDAKALQNAKEAAVSVRINMDSGKPGKAYTLNVTSDMAAKAGFSKPEGFENTVTILDAMVAAHQKMYGDDFGKDPGKYLVINGGWIQKFWGIETGAIGYLLNDQSPADLNGSATLCNNSPIKTGDVVTVYQYGDTQYYSDTYLYFVDSQIQQKEPGEVSLTLMRSGYDANWKPVSSPQENCKVALTDSNGKQVAEGTTDKDGIVTFKISEAGSYSADVTAAPFDYYVSAHADITVGDSQVVDPDDPSKDDMKKDDPKKDNAIQDLNKNKTSLQAGAGENGGSDGSAGGSASGSSAKTGDDAQLYVWMMLMLASMVAAVYIYAAAQRWDDRF